MGGWLWLISASLVVALMGLYIHWSVVVAGALLPFLVVTRELVRRRRARAIRERDPAS